ncbi:MAG: hypothetical protein ACK56I_27295 [bacterium]
MRSFDFRYIIQNLDWLGSAKKDLTPVIAKRIIYSSSGDRGSSSSAVRQRSYNIFLQRQRSSDTSP